MAQSYLRNPSVERLPVVLEELHSGSLRIPPFQRDFEWTGEQRIALCSSIRLGLPTGSLMVWRTSHKLAEENPIGPFSPVLIQPPTQYLLDGRQRMTTLYAALAAGFWTREGKVPTSREAEGASAPDGTPWAIYFDLGAQEFVFNDQIGTPDGATSLDLFPGSTNDHRLLLPLGVLLDDAAYDDWRARASLSRERVNRARALRSAFADYLIPIVPLATDDIGVVTLTFKRVNSGGTPMGAADMTRALAWSEKFDLREQIEGVREKLRPLHWGEIEDDAILKVVAAVSLPDFTEIDAERLAAKIRSEPLQVETAGDRTAAAVRILGERLGIKGPGSLPYTQILVFAAHAIHHAGGSLTAEQEKKLVAWVAEVCLDERFGGAPSHMIRAYLRALLHRLGLPTSEAPRPRDDRKSTAKECWVFSMAWARSRGTALVLAAQAPRTAGGVRLEDSYALIAQGSENLGMLLAQNGDGLPATLRYRLKAKTLATALRSPANRVVCPPQDLPALRRCLFQANCPSEILQSHLIDEETHRALLGSDLETFFEGRRATILEAEKRWASERGGAVDIRREFRSYAQP